MAGKVRPNKKKKGLIIALIIIAVVIISVGAVYINRVSKARQNLEALNDLDTIAYAKGELSASISGTGTVRANQTATLTWATSGTVGDVKVSLGDQVYGGALLVSLDEVSIPIDILQAQIDVINIQQSLDALYDNAPLELAQAKLDLITAEKTLDNMATDRAIMNYQRCSDDRIDELQEKYDSAKTMHERFPTSYTLQALNTALANLNYCQAGYSEEEVAEAEARVSLAEEKVINLKNKIETLKDGPNPDEITKLLTQKQIALARLAKKDITAPFDSTITAIYNQQGDLITNGMMAIQLADLSELYVDVQISEVDVHMIKVGQPAELVFDAFFEDNYSGEVVEIAPIGNEIQGVVTYNVTVKLLSGMETIKSGMTAAVNIITEQIENIYVIPTDALVTVEGQDNVYVMRKGIPTLVEITTGGFSDDMVEVISAEIEDGELIIINPPTSLLGSMDGGFGGGGSMPGFLGGR
ncbi:MAG: efflux RND transporter periplasmic adaptor subunit [Anaerolineaceae bacterium]|nr:efflux RND transporter periplasmic adaptor subunit [Anaerolineaceae bacterium]